MAEAHAPFSDMNTTPLIDVMLVLLIMFIITIPVVTHTMEVDLPACNDCKVPLPEPDRNKIVIDGSDRLLWNGQGISEAELGIALALTRQMPVEPELQFEPAAQASYDRTAKTLSLIKASGVTKFGFVGNERYRTF